MSLVVLLIPLLAEQTSFALVLGAVVTVLGFFTSGALFLVRSQNRKNDAEAGKLNSEAEKTRVDSAAGLVAINERTLKNVENELIRQDKLIKELRDGDDAKAEQIRACDERIDSLRRRMFEVLERLDEMHDQLVAKHDENVRLRAERDAERAARRKLERERDQERSW